MELIWGNFSLVITSTIGGEKVSSLYYLQFTKEHCGRARPI